jgi:hypothetical protein
VDVLAMSFRSGFPKGALRRLLFGAGSLAVSVWAAPARAEALCSVELAGENTEGWLGSGRMPEIPEGADCESVRIEVEGNSARVTFVTRDGRRAERIVHDPSELGPTLGALGVTGARESAPVSKEPLRARPVRPVATPVEADRAPTWNGEAARAERDHAAIFALTAGTRAGADNLVSPLFTGSASLSLDRWELGVMGALEAQYFDVAAEPRRAPGSAISAGVLAGRRQPLGSAAVFLGTRLVLAALNDESEVDEGRRGRAEMRLGSYLGLALPSAAKTRFRAEIAADAVPEDLGGKAADSLEATITPWWAISLSLGLEFGG